MRGRTSYGSSARVCVCVCVAVVYGRSKKNKKKKIVLYYTYATTGPRPNTAGSARTARRRATTGSAAVCTDRYGPRLG